MDYKSLMGYGKKKNPTKKQSKPKKNQILEGIKTNLNEFDEKMFKQDLKEVGSAAEYRPHIKRINKLYDEYGAAVGDFETLLTKKGLKKEAKGIKMIYGRLVMKFHNTLNKMLGKLM